MILPSSLIISSGMGVDGSSTARIEGPPFHRGASASKEEYGSVLQDAQKGRSARPQRVKTGGVPSGAHGATNKEHHVCARRRVGEAAGSPLRI